MRKLSIIIPAYNEEKVLEKCLESVLNIFSPEDVYVVSDGSTDRTAEIALSYTDNVLNLTCNQGKIGAIKRLIETYRLTDDYQYIMFHDADSRILQTREYFQKQLPLPDDVAVLCAQVRSPDKKSFFDSYRTYDYFIAHYIYKNAQSLMRCILVAPGCLSIYKSDVLAKLSFDKDTLTEDMDLTFQIYRNKLGRVVYDAKLLVDSHNPQNLKNYYMQIRRWYIGFWQNAKKHSLMKRFSTLDLEVGIFTMESFFVLFWLLILPSLIAIYPKIIVIPFLANWLVVLGMGIFVGFYMRRWYVILWSPFFILMQMINLMTFLGAFFGYYLFASTRAKEEEWYFQER